MITKGLFTSNTPEWATPQAFFNELNNEFHFDLDIAANEENHKCDKYYTKETDGLAHQKDWIGTVWCNPPYGREIVNWVKACSEYRGGVCVMLLPARTDTRWFHDYIYHKASEIRFIKGRLHFNESKEAAPFPSMVVVYRASQGVQM